MAIEKQINIVVKETGIDQVNKSIQQLETAVEQTEQATKSFKTQLREANQELIKVSQKFGETSKEAVQAAKKVADLKDQMELANDLVKSFNPDQKFKALGAATQVAGTGLQGVTAGMALFGEQSESTQKTLLQVQAAMSFSDAISNLSNLGDQWAILKTAINSSSAATKINTAATGAAAMVQKLFTGSVATTTVGFKLLRGAIIATGIGALVVGVGLLINNFDKVKKVVLNFIPGLAKVGDMVMNIVNSVTDFLGVTSEAERMVDKQKAVAEKALKQNELYLKKNEHKLSEARKREIELSQEHYQRIIDGEMTKEESLKIMREKYQIDRQKKQEEANKIQEEKDKEAKEKAKQAEQKRLDDEKKADEARLQKIKDDAEKAKAINDQAAQDMADVEEFLNGKKEEQSTKEEQAGADKMARIQREYDAEKKLADDKIILDNQVKDAKLDIANQTLNLISEIAGKGSAVAKATAVTQATISGVQGVQNAFTTASASPVTTVFPAYPFIQAGLAGAFSALQIGKILQGDKPSSGGSAPSGSGQAPQAPSFNLVQGTGRNQIAEGLNNQAPVKVYVVSKDVSTGQSMDRNIITSASL